MDKVPLKVISLVDSADHQNLSLASKCEQAGITIRLVAFHGKNLASILLKALDEEEPGTRLLVLTGLKCLYDVADLTTLHKKLSAYDNQVLFAASSFFRFDRPELHYFYWKHYPRPHDYFNFPDSSVLTGKTNEIKGLLEDVIARFSNEAISYSFNDLISRYYADEKSGCFKPLVEITLDHNQDVFASTRLSARKTLERGWIYELLYGKNETEIYKNAGKLPALRHPLNVLKTGNTFYHKLTGTHPLFIITEQLTEKTAPSSFVLNTRTRLRTLKQLMTVKRVNRWHTGKEKIFRYSRNGSREVSVATERLVRRLEAKLPVSFAHYNDGELTFIRDFMNSADHDKWFGRKQQQYDPLLAERLLQAMKFRKEGYFVGVPCAVDHPELRQLANEITGEYEYKIPAMTIHHNLAYMPRILHALRDREVYFFTNEYQDLSFFQHFGIQVEPEKTFTVPFRNSYLEYDQYQHMTFPEEAVVVLTCGMLAKILTRAWYEKQNNLTVLALGSSLDDHIQKENIRFRLYPEDMPLTRNIHNSRSFLFGYKRPCPECYSY